MSVLLSVNSPALTVSKNSAIPWLKLAKTGQNRLKLAKICKTNRLKSDKVGCFRFTVKALRSYTQVLLPLVSPAFGPPRKWTRLVWGTGLPKATWKPGCPSKSTASFLPLLYMQS